MIERLTRLAALAWSGWLLLALGLTWTHAWTPVRLLVVACGFALHPAVLLAECLLMRRVSRLENGQGPPLARVLRAWARECLASSGGFLWRMAWRSRAVPDRVGPGLQGRRGVVLVHGFVCNRALWNPLLRQLQARGHPFIALTLEPVFGGIDVHAADLEAAVRRLHEATGCPPVLVGHSMGGLVIRAWLRAVPGAAARTDSVITIGTPHGGTWLARFASSVNGRQMRRDSAWLADLGETPGLPPDRFTCWWSDCDQIVFPPPAAVLPGSRARLIPGVAHVALSQRPEVREDLLRRLAG